MNFSHVAVFVAIVELAFSAGAGEALHEPRRINGDESARIAKLRVEIAALDAQARGDSPEVAAELRAWEGKMAEPAEWSASGAAGRRLPEWLTKILALEPSERTEAQRAALLEYFLPLSKVATQARWHAAKKRVELAMLLRKMR